MNICNNYFKSLEKYPDNCALQVQNHQLSYSELWGLANKIYNEIVNSKNYSKTTYIGILAYRTDLFYASVIAILASGKAFMPFNPKNPVERAKAMISLSEAKILIVGTEFQNQFNEIDLSNSIHIITTDSSNFKHHLVSQLGDSKHIDMKIIDVPENNPAYLLFTSGTTGVPKGIPISQNNFIAYIDYISENYPLRNSDRCTQVFDTTFDLSMHDLFVTWSAGAALCVLSTNELISPIKFIQKNSITAWFSVPSMIISLSRMKLLKPGILDSIRISFFCGEAFTADSAKKWNEAAPNSRIINLYGPTETTIAVAEFEVKSDSYSSSRNGVIPIGKLFSSHNYCIIDQSFNPVKQGEEGELCICGPQVCSGYLKNEEKTKIQFITIPQRGGQNIYYRTGDLVVENANGIIDYLGRIDFQVKIRGYRVELQEIESSIIKYIQKEPVVVISFPFNSSNADYLVGVVPKESKEKENDIISYCSSVLPEYMVPKKIIYLEQFPININGKIDRKAIIKNMEELL